MTLHFSENAVNDQAKKAAKRKTRKYTVLGALGAVLILPAAAYAAVTLWGFGDVSASATEIQALTITDVSLTAPLVPGVTVGSKGIVHNPNNFPVTVTDVITRTTGLGVTGVGCVASTVHPVGTFGSFGGAVGDGWKQALTPVTIAANSAEWVTVPEAVLQDSGATAMCGFTAKIAVQAHAGN